MSRAKHKESREEIKNTINHQCCFLCVAGKKFRRAVTIFNERCQKQEVENLMKESREAKKNPISMKGAHIHTYSVKEIINKMKCDAQF